MDENNFVKKVAERLREERLRLNYSQEEVGTACGMSGRTVISWEQGSKVPSHCLAMLVVKGFDVTYILTGVRVSATQSQEPAKAEEKPVSYEATALEEEGEEDFSQQEKVIVKKLRKLPQRERDEIQELVEKAEQAHVSKVNFTERWLKAG